ncbi:hypothetical protein [Gardnerella sp. KA00735]|uniref:hypothetical protein n=1 Tax=Gardnerella sp. KA00735 TaxID=1973156 RepID=UPI000C9FA69E|nr:hypothetical protein [Gardnerella sp. KA00735]PNP88902.1 hypothetical protein BFS08_06185 [Gardnerella sp. KA00735]
MSDVNNSIDDFSSKNQVNNTPENSNYSNEDNNNSFKQQQDSSAYESSMNSDASISFDPKSSSPSSDSSNLHGQSSQYSQSQYPQAQPQQSQYSQMQFNQQNAQFNQPVQPYAPQNYNQSSQAYNQFNQPQFAQAQAQFAQPQQQYPQAQYPQPQFAQAQYPQSQYSQMQFNGQSSYKKPDYSHSMTYNQNSSQYGYRQNAEAERLETYYSSTWNKREKILLAIICVVSIFLTYFSNRVLYVWFNIYTIHYYHILPQLFMVDFLWFSYSLLPFTLILSFAIVLRKKYSVILPSICSVVTSFLVEIFFRFIVEKDYNFEYYLKFIVYAILPIVIFVIALEVLQCKFMIRKRSNIVSSIILTFASSFIYVFVYFTSLTILFNSRYEVSDYMYGMISSVILLVVIPVLVALIMKLLGLPKFLNPQREEMNL